MPKDHNQREQLGSRTIVFIAHSLGGLVCEEALILSDKRQELQNILTNTLGIIFMGTPHGSGSDDLIAPWPLCIDYSQELPPYARYWW
jgi:hypothetical protein